MDDNSSADEEVENSTVQNESKNIFNRYHEGLFLKKGRPLFQKSISASVSETVQISGIIYQTPAFFTMYSQRGSRYLDTSVVRSATPRLTPQKSVFYNLMSRYLSTQPTKSSRTANIWVRKTDKGLITGVFKPELDVQLTRQKAARDVLQAFVQNIETKEFDWETQQELNKALLILRAFKSDQLLLWNLLIPCWNPSKFNSEERKGLFELQRSDELARVPIGLRAALSRFAIQAIDIQDIDTLVRRTNISGLNQDSGANSDDGSNTVEGPGNDAESDAAERLANETGNDAAEGSGTESENDAASESEDRTESETGEGGITNFFPRFLSPTRDTSTSANLLDNYIVIDNSSDDSDDAESSSDSQASPSARTQNDQ